MNTHVEGNNTSTLVIYSAFMSHVLHVCACRYVCLSLAS